MKCPDCGKDLKIDDVFTKSRFCTNKSCGLYVSRLKDYDLVFHDIASYLAGGASRRAPRQIEVKAMGVKE